MAADRIYISVILPLRLEWEPCYSYTGDIPCPPESMTGPEAEIKDNRTEGVRRGDRVRVQFAGKEYIGTVDQVGILPQISPDKIKGIISVERELAPVSEEERTLWKQVAEYYMCSIGEVSKAAYPAGKISGEKKLAGMQQREEERRNKKISLLREKLAKLQGKRPQEGKIREKIAAAEAELQRLQGLMPGEGNTLPMPDDRIMLSQAQEKAFLKIKEAFGKGMPALLKGVTGSGKTEIYTKLACECIRAGKNVLYMVPEIALGRHLEMRLQEVFGARLMTFHSGESMARRRDTADRVRTAEGYIVLGTRSSIFLPHHNLGLIIVDEEHDSSYKQDSPAPRYNGRDTAVMLAGIHGCDIVLGSATPSLESLYNCMSGKYTIAELKERYHHAEDAEIEIIDTIAERKKNGMRGSFSVRLIEHIRETLDEEGQVMLFRARRSFSPAVQCIECGFIPKCPHCNVSLSLHKGKNDDGHGRLVCHSCGYSAPFTGQCQKCGGKMRGLGTGTQKIEEEVSALFPSARVARLDSDTAQSPVYSKETVRKFSKGETDILIGTQMVTKGFDFPNLRLVAVLQADTLLGIEDFRADEKAAQLLEQFRGRCGRRDRRGLFVIQTSAPDHPVYRILAEGTKIEETSLLSERKLFSYPPYTRVINIEIRDKSEQRAMLMSTKLCGILEAGAQPYALTGPFSPAVDKAADNYIRVIRLNLRKDKNLVGTKRRIMTAVNDFESKEKYAGHIAIDVDPI